MAINFWRRFEALIKPASMSVVTITAINADGTSTATTMGGASIRLRGTSVAVGDKAFTAVGEVLDKAPNLTYLEIEV